MTVELSIVIVNWNGGHFLRQCITSIFQAPPSVSYDIIVVDNASTDDSVGWLQSKEMKSYLGNIQLHLIQNADNLGFGKANNQAIAYSKAPMLFLLNSDAEVTPGAIDTLIATLISDERIGACGPRLLNPDGSLQPSVRRNPPSAWEILVSVLRLYRLIPKRIRGELLLGGYWDHGRRRRVPFLSGAAILSKREMIANVGGFDERFHMYGEDVEWCLRIVRAGWWLVFEPDAIVVHYNGGSSLKRWSNLEKYRIQCEGFLFFQSQCLPRRQAIINGLANYSMLSLVQLWRRMRRHPKDDIEIALELYVKYIKQLFMGIGTGQ